MAYLIIGAVLASLALIVGGAYLALGIGGLMIALGLIVMGWLALVFASLGY